MAGPKIRFPGNEGFLDYIQPELRNLDSFNVLTVLQLNLMSLANAVENRLAVTSREIADLFVPTILNTISVFEQNSFISETSLEIYKVMIPILTMTVLATIARDPRFTNEVSNLMLHKMSSELGCEEAERINNKLKSVNQVLLKEAASIASEVIKKR